MMPYGKDYDEDGHPIDAGRRLVVTRGADVKLQKIRWWLPDWIPAGALTLLAGREGLGKSTIACAWCARETKQGNNILYLHSEDSREHTVAPRLKAAGADMDRVLFVDVHTDDTETASVVLPVDTDRLDQLIAEHDITFVVLDAATSVMSSTLSGKDDRQVRQFLEPLGKLATRHDIVVLGLVHFGKREGEDSGKLILGSIAWSQVARSVLSIAYDDDNDRLVVTNTKGNLATRTRSEACRVVSKTVAVGDDITDVGVIDWLGETDQDARELLAGYGDVGDRSEVDDWLRAVLADGRVKATEIFSAADAAGYSKDKAKRAKKNVGAIAEKDGPWWWSLPPTEQQGCDQESHAQNRAPLLPSPETAGQPTEQGSSNRAREQREQGSVHNHTPAPLLCPNCQTGMTFDEDIANGAHISCRLEATA